MSTKTFSLINEHEKRVPKLPFSAIKDAILGKSYILNVIIAEPSEIERLNTIYRDKEYPTDILSFPISENEGDIYLCLEEAEKERSKFNRKYENFVTFLFIHGCVHLKGYDHGSRMEELEAKFRKEFSV